MKAFSFSLVFDEGKAIRLAQPQPTLAKHSFSAIINATSLITKHFPTLKPPIFREQALKHPKATQQSEDYGLYHPYEVVWCEYLCQLVEQGSAVRHQDCLYLQVPVSGSTLQDAQAGLANVEQGTFVTMDKLPNAQSVFQRICLTFELPPIEPAKKKVGLLVYRSEKIEDIFAPRWFTLEIHLGNFYCNEQWRFIRLNGEHKVPSVEQLASYDCLLSPGSVMSILSPSPQVADMVKLLMEARKLNPSLKFMGICFGQQLLCRGLNCSIVRKNYIGQTETMQVDSKVTQKYPFLESLSHQTSFIVSSFHEDYIQDVPKGFELLAWGKNCGVEALVSEDGLTFTTQFHGEYLWPYKKLHEKKKMFYHKPDYQDKTTPYPIDQQTEAKHAQDSMSWMTAVCRFIGQK